MSFVQLHRFTKFLSVAQTESDISAHSGAPWRIPGTITTHFVTPSHVKDWAGRVPVVGPTPFNHWQLLFDGEEPWLPDVLMSSSVVPNSMWGERVHFRWVWRSSASRRKHNVPAMTTNEYTQRHSDSSSISLFVCIGLSYLSTSPYCKELQRGILRDAN